MSPRSSGRVGAVVKDLGVIDNDNAAFEAAWERCMSWLALHCPIDYAALRSPAGADEIAALEAGLGFRSIRT